MKKIAIRLISFFIIIIMLPTLSVYGQEEIMDQSTPLGYNGYICGMNNNFLAQSFKPKLPVLTKLELGFFKMENITGNFTISIRTRLNGEDITSKTMSTEDVQYMQYGGWVEIDIEDINVNPDDRYYIIFTSDDARVVFWIQTLYTPYWRGRPWSLGGSLPFWLPMFLIVTKLPDMSFRTYGYDQ